MAKHLTKKHSKLLLQTYFMTIVTGILLNNKVREIGFSLIGF
jgi:hypothetical protein